MFDTAEVRNAVLIVVLALSSFWTMFRHFFIAVDFAFLRQASSGGLISSGRFYGQFYRPMEDFLWAVFFSVFGLRPEYYYLIAFCVHVINGYLVLRFGLRIFKDSLLALCSGLFFVTFSVANEAVFWLSANLNEGIYTMFLLLSLIFFSKFLERGLRRDFMVSLSVYVLSLLSKESAIVGPVLILLTGWLFRIPLRSAIRKSLPYAIFALGFAAARSLPYLAGEFNTQGLYKIGPNVAINMIAYLISLATFGALTTWARFGGNYLMILRASGALTSFTWVLALGLIPAFLILLKFTGRLTKYFVLWILVTLLSYTPLVYLQIRYMYAATIGLALFLSSKLTPSRSGSGINLRRFSAGLRVATIIAIIGFAILSNNIGSAYYDKLGSAYRNILQDIRPAEGRFPDGSVLIFVDLPEVTSGNTLPTVQAAVRLYYGQTLTVVTVDSNGLRDAVAKYQGRPVFVFKFDPDTFHVTQISP